MINEQVVVSAGVRQPTALQVFGNRVYYTDAATRELLSAPLLPAADALPRQREQVAQHSYKQTLI